MTSPGMEALAELVRALPYCNKGACLAPATRVAPYYADGKVVAEWDSCDRDGGPTIREFEYADALRAAAQLLESEKLYWWDPGSLDPPTSKCLDESRLPPKKER